MIDWVKAKIPFRHKEAINDGQVFSIDSFGEIEWKTQKRLALRGSYESSVNILSCDQSRCPQTGDYTHVIIDGNPVKYFQGHNLWGTNDLVGLVMEFTVELSRVLNLRIANNDLSKIIQGDYQLFRVDSTMMVSCGNNANVDSILYSVERLAHMRYKGKALASGSTLYFGKHSRRESLKMYNKAKEIKAKGHELHTELAAFQPLNDWVADKLRIEAVTRSMQLKDYRLNLASSWREETPNEILDRLLDAIDMSENYTLTPDAVQNLPGRLQLAYNNWKDGHDLKKLLSDTTFKRYRKQLKETVGIDIAIVQGNRKEPAPNVVDFRRILRPERCEQIPDWAIGTKLYFEPRTKISA
jgi:II/X family phage/plasmid replication protein